jgi:hypothetical protein
MSHRPGKVRRFRREEPGFVRIGTGSTGPAADGRPVLSFYAGCKSTFRTNGLCRPIERSTGLR